MALLQNQSKEGLLHNGMKFPPTSLHAQPCPSGVSQEKPDPVPWPTLENYKNRIYKDSTLNLPFPNLLASQVPEIIPLLLGVRAFHLFFLLPKD